MQINKCIEIIDLCLFLTKSKTLIIPDVHIGYEEALNKQGVLIPRTQFIEIMKNIEKVMKDTIKRFKAINKIVIIGDLKHEFGTISETEWRQTLKFLDFLDKYCKNIILLKGNHDTILGPIADKRRLEVKTHIMIDDILLMHGHELPTNILPEIKTIIIGHEHTAISLKHGVRIEKFKCFLKGKWNLEEEKRKLAGISKNKLTKLKDKLRRLKSKKLNLIVMPSFNPIIEGTDITKEQLLSPFLRKTKIKDFRVFIVGDKIYDFGKIRDLMRK
ncbi:MAG: metallophosphoesterase [Candidatus Woesearchaeota archaeon]